MRPRYVRRKSRNGAIAIGFVIAAVVIVALLTVTDAKYPAGIDADAHYLDPIEMVCHYYPLEAERVRARSDIQEALRRRWDVAWAEELSESGGPREFLRRACLYARASPPQGLGLTRAEEHMFLEETVYRPFAEGLVSLAGVRNAMRPDGGPVFR